jgi:hypothetical protein
MIGKPSRKRNRWFDDLFSGLSLSELKTVHAVLFELDNPLNRYTLTLKVASSAVNRQRMCEIAIFWETGKHPDYKWPVTHDELTDFRVATSVFLPVLISEKENAS